MSTENPQTFHLTIDQIISILNAVVPFASAIILFHLASLKELRVSKKDVYKERLTNYYIPFYQMYCRGFLSEYPLSEMPFKNRGLFLDLFSKNLQYMDRKSQGLYPKYYRAFLNLMEAEELNAHNLDACRIAFSSVFAEITKSTLSEYKRLLRKLKMPIPDI